MKPWHIEWTQTIDGREHRHTEAVVAATAALAIAKWSEMSWINARVDAVYDPQIFTAVRAQFGHQILQRF